MPLTLSKRFEFGASHRFYRSEWSSEKNRDFFGSNAQGKFGHGHNYETFFVFTGDIKNQDGMVMELAKVKHHLLERVLIHYDHFFLNTDTTPFNLGIQPSVENIATTLLKEVQTAFQGWPITPTACHLIEHPQNQATAYAHQATETHLTLILPSIPTQLLYETELTAFSHPILLRITLEHPQDLYLDQFNLSQHVEAKFKEWAVNTHFALVQSLPTHTPPLHMWALTWWPILNAIHPIKRIKLSSFDTQTCEYNGSDSLTLSKTEHLCSGHRLCDNSLTPETNTTLFGRCNRHHGHNFKIEITSKYDIKTLGHAHPILAIQSQFEHLHQDWDFHSLSEECPDFKNKLATCEHILLALINRLCIHLPISRVRVWETQNNRFTWRA